MVRVWGPGALAVADAVFRPARGDRLSATPVNRPRFGRAGDGLGDEVVAVVTDDTPAEVEIHTHGGPAPLSLVVNALVTAGAERREPEDWLRARAPSSISAEARIDLPRASTLRAAEVLLDQIHGALDRDFAEIERLVATDPASARHHIEALRARSAVGLRLLHGWTVALAGRPNVGKSSLLNALAGYDRAIVDPGPGTTRDVVAVRTAFDGWPVELLDTAGLRESDDPIEAAGIDLARGRQARADLVILVLDRSEPLTPADHDLLMHWPSALVVASKVDLPAAWLPDRDTMLGVSASTGEGLPALAEVVARRLVLEPPAPGVGVPFRAEHLARLDGLERRIKL